MVKRASKHFAVKAFALTSLLLQISTGNLTWAGVMPPEILGKINFYQLARVSSFDKYTKNPTTEQQAWMRDHYQRMDVSSPYFDSRLSWYPKGWAYFNSYAIYVGGTVAAAHPEWIMRDANGNKLYIPWGCSNGTCPQYAGDFANPQFRKYQIDQMAALIAKGYPGLGVDDVNLIWRAGDGTGKIVTPQDSNMGAQMTLSGWQNYMATFMEEARAALPNIEIVHNVIWFADSVNNYNPYIDRQVTAADYISLERGGTDKGLVGGGGTWGYETFLEYIDYVHGLGRGVALLDYGTTIQDREYGLATWFLISDGIDFMSSDQLAWTAPDSWWSGYELNLGDSLGARYKWGNLIRRDYQCGVVLLNQPGFATQAVYAAPGLFTTIDGASVTTLSLGSKTAIVLQKTCENTTVSSNKLSLQP